MRSFATSRPLFSLAAALMVIALVGMKQLHIMELLAGSQWQCSSFWVASAFRILIWVLFDDGRSIIAAVITAFVALSVLYWNSVPEARELVAAISMLLAFLVFAVIQGETSSHTENCIQAQRISQVRRG